MRVWVDVWTVEWDYLSLAPVRLSLAPQLSLAPPSPTVLLALVQLATRSVQRALSRAREGCHQSVMITLPAGAYSTYTKQTT